jgi:hypothetical protein
VAQCTRRATHPGMERSRTFQDLLDMMLGTTPAAVLRDQDEADAHSSGDVDAEPPRPIGRRPPVVVAQPGDRIIP